MTIAPLSGQLSCDARAVVNAEQIRIWNEVNAARWLKLRGPLTATLTPYGEAAMDALAPRRGERLLDVGCGFGETTTELARRSGNVLGVDVVEQFLAIARAEAAPGARYLLADAQTHPFEDRFEERFDGIYSRFGLMFFEDPAAAFANLRSALRPSGRLAAVVWGPPEDNEWSGLPMQVLRRHMPVREPGRGPGPFGLSDRAALARLLAGAGFVRADVAPLRLPFAADVSVLLQTGVAAAALREAGPEGERLRPQLEQELREAIGGRAVEGVALLVQASAPAVDTPPRIQ